VSSFCISGVPISHKQPIPGPPYQVLQIAIVQSVRPSVIPSQQLLPPLHPAFFSTSTTQLDAGNYITTNHIMRIPEVVKQVLKTVSGPKPKPEARIDVNDPESGCEELPGTSVRQLQGPEPGKLGIIFYYISLALCMVGVCILLRCGFIEESERISLLVFGLLLLVAGLLSLSIANYIYNREQRMLVTYLQDKVDMMKIQFHNNRVPTLSERESLHS